MSGPAHTSTTIRARHGDRVRLEFILEAADVVSTRSAEIDAEFSGGCILLTDRRSGGRAVLRTALTRPAEKL